MKLVKFTQATCMPCKVLDQMLISLEAQVDEVIGVDSPVGADIASDFDVMGTPTLLLLDNNGNEVERVIGTDFGQIQSILKLAGKL